MAIQKFEDDLNIISKLGDNPGTDNGLTTPQFRAMFDKAGLLIQKFINDVILPAMNASNNPQEGLSMQGGINMNGQMLNGIKTPGADDEAANKGYVDGKRFVPANVVLSAAGWSADAPYTQTVAVEGILKTDRPHYCVVLSEDRETALAEKEAFAMVDDLDTADGSITFTCLEDKPSVALTIQMEVNR